MRSFAFAVALLGALLSEAGWLGGTAASAATKAERHRAAAELVSEALFHEIYGQDSKRSEFLASALKQVPDYAPALWHSGRVGVRDGWVKYDELPKLAAEDERLTAYRHVRQKYPKTLQGRLALAEWCAKQKLVDQQRAHLTEVLEINPDHQQARRLLGYRLVDGAWLSQQEISQAGIRARQVADALRQWTPRLTQIRKDLRQRSKRQREEATKRLRAIADPAAVPAIELVFCGDNEQAALLGVRTLGQIAAHEAAVALARQAVFSPWQNVREAAAGKLKTRDRHDYVPPLLSALQSPVQSRAGIYQEPSGRLAYRHILYREGQEHRELAVFDTMYSRSFSSNRAGGENETAEAAIWRTPVLAARNRLRPGRITGLGRPAREGESVGTITATSYEWDPLEYRAAVQRDAAVKARLLEMALAQQNAMVQRFNQCVFDVLSVATGAIVLRTPESWWQWWNAYNEVFVPEYKPYRTAYKRDGRDVLVGEARTRSYDVVSVNSSCLAAGTPVWTEWGPTPIDKIRVGDRVLSQNVETGELTYKPVLKTTVRPPARWTKFNAGGDKIVCTGGHPFWICGDGWVMARHLTPGTRFHSVTGTMPVHSVETAGEGRAYNLVVADFHTYFVGDAKILSHDNTIRKPANVLVPGLADR